MRSRECCLFRKVNANPPSCANGATPHLRQAQKTRRRPEILAERIAWRPDERGDTVEIDLIALFGSILGHRHCDITRPIRPYFAGCLPRRRRGSVSDLGRRRLLRPRRSNTCLAGTS